MNIKLVLLFGLVIGVLVKADVECLTSLKGDSFILEQGLCLWEYASGFNTPRQLITLSNGDIILIQGSSVTLLYDSNKDGYIDSKEVIYLANSSKALTHSVAYDNGYIYASSINTIYRWPYTIGIRAAIQKPAEIVISGIPTGGHITRTILFDNNNKFYFSIGSLGNIDNDFNNARIYYCNLDLLNVPSGGWDYTTCTPLYNGTRNEVGLKFDPNGVLWGVENGIDRLSRSDMAFQIDYNNPCEEINKFSVEGFYGYPYCFSEGIIPSPPGMGPGTQWAVDKFRNNESSGITDQYCEQNAIKPAYCMPAHSAPLDLLFYNSSALPDIVKTGLFVTQHGTYYRVPASGYQVVHFDVEYSNNEYSIVPDSMKKIIGSSTPDIPWDIRPVSLTKLSPCGPVSECFLFTSDRDGIVYAFSGQVDGTFFPSPIKPPSRPSSPQISYSNQLISNIWLLFFVIVLSIF